MLIDVSKYDIKQLDALLDDIVEEKKKRAATQPGSQLIQHQRK